MLDYPSSFACLGCILGMILFIGLGLTATLIVHVEDKAKRDVYREKVEKK